MPHNNIPHPEMVAKSEEVRQVMTPEWYARLISLIPDPDRYLQIHNRFEGSVTESFKGDPQKVKECEEARHELNVALSVIMGVSKAVSILDPTVNEKLGGTHQKSSPAGAPLAAAKDLRIFFDKDGQPYCSLSKLIGSKGYDVWFCQGEPGIESNWKWLTWSTLCKKIYLQGLNRTLPNYLKVRGKRGNEIGPWSNMVILPPV